MAAATGKVPGDDWTVVTGANRGLGYGVAKRLAEQGRGVVLAARTQSSADEASARLAAETGKPDIIGAVALDTSDPESISAAVHNLVKGFEGKLDTLINNAAVMDRGGKPSLQELWAPNVLGIFQLIRELAPHMKQGGHIVNVSSELGLLRQLPETAKRTISVATTLEELEKVSYTDADASKLEGMYAPYYSLSKAALNRATQLLATDPVLISRGITVAAVTPGWCRTDMGGSGASRSVEEGVASIIAAAEDPRERRINGAFWRDGQQLSMVDGKPV